jgi:hypothetical protein
MGLPPTWNESERNDEAEAEWNWRAFDMAPEIATALGISPLALTESMRVRGVGVLVETPVPVR